MLKNTMFMGGSVSSAPRKIGHDMVSDAWSGSILKSATVSVIIPCKNEAGTVAELVARMPRMGSLTELVFVEGGSHDDTRALLYEIQNRQNSDVTRKRMPIRVVEQTGRGKFNAVLEACACAQGDLVIIFDGDMTFAPEQLVLFYELLVSGRARVANGSRLIVPMEAGAMRWMNWWANQGFAVLVSLLVGQRVTDTLCGTKALWRSDLTRALMEHKKLLDLDPFGDFFYLLSAARYGHQIAEVPVYYRARKYGKPLTGCFRYGLRLLKMLFLYVKMYHKR